MPSRALAERVKTPVIASGGVGSLEDLERLASLPLAGCIVGRALYEGRFTLAEAIARVEAVSSCRKSLLVAQVRQPVILNRGSIHSQEVQPPIWRPRFHDHNLSHRRHPERCPGWTWGVGQDQPCRRPALRRRSHHAQGIGRRRDQHARHRRRGEAPALHDRLPHGPSGLERQAGAPDRLARLSRFHRQSPSAPWRRWRTSSWPSPVPRGSRSTRAGLFQEARRLGLGRFIAITKMDAENVDYRADLEAIRETFGLQCVPFNVPVGQGAAFSGVVDVLQEHDDNPPGCPLPPTEAYQMVVEQIVETDEELMMRYLEGESIGVEELRKAAHDAIASGKLVPVLCVCTQKDLGVKELLDLITTCGLSPADVHRFGTRGEGESAAEEEILPAEEGTLVAQVFKTANDQFMGKMSYLRILSGRIAPDTTLVNLRSGKTTQGRAHLRAPGQAAGGGARGHRRRHRGGCQVRRPARFRHGEQRRRQYRGLPAQGPADQVPDPDGPPRRAAQGARGRGQDLGRTGQDRRRGSDLLDPPRHPDPRAGDLGNERPSSGHHPAAAQEPLQAGDDHAHSPRPLPGDHLGQCRGRPPSQEADGRPRPVRRGPPPRAAARARQGVQLRRRREGRNHPQPVHPGRREGRARADGQGDHLGQPGRRHRGRGLLRQGPPGRQLGAGVQDGRGHGVAKGASTRPGRFCSSRSCRSR